MILFDWRVKFCVRIGRNTQHIYWISIIWVYLVWNASKSSARGKKEDTRREERWRSSKKQKREWMNCTRERGNVSVCVCVCEESSEAAASVRGRRGRRRGRRRRRELKVSLPRQSHWYIKSYLGQVCIVKNARFLHVSLSCSFLT